METTDDAAIVGPAEDRAPTKRVVVKHEDVIVLPGGVTDEQVREALAVLYGKRAPKGSRAEAWVVIGEFAGESKDRAIEAYTGKAGEADTKQGTFKAPTVTAWAGGVCFEAPPLPLVRKRAIE